MVKHTVDKVDNPLKKFDSVLVNLNTLSSINKNDKLYIKNSALVIQPYSSTRAFTRWWNSYNRRDSIKFIEELYKDLSLLITFFTSTSIIDQNMKKIQYRRLKRRNKDKKNKLIQAAKDTKQGLLHLMVTYKNDQNFTDFVNKHLSIIREMY